MPTARADTVRATKLRRIHGNRSFPRWDRLQIDRTTGKVTFSMTLPAQFRGDKIYGRQSLSLDGEIFDYEITTGSPLTVDLRWRPKEFDREAPDEDTESYVEEDDGHRPDPNRRWSRRT